MRRQLDLGGLVATSLALICLLGAAAVGALAPTRHHPQRPRTASSRRNSVVEQWAALHPGTTLADAVAAVGASPGSRTAGSGSGSATRPSAAQWAALHPGTTLADAVVAVGATSAGRGSRSPSRASEHPVVAVASTSAPAAGSPASSPTPSTTSTASATPSATPPTPTATPSATSGAPAVSFVEPSNPQMPIAGEATAWGCAAALAYLYAYAAPGYTFQCPGDALGHEGMTECVSGESPCSLVALIVIADPCPAAYMNEASNSWSLMGLSDAPIDPYGACP